MFLQNNNLKIDERLGSDSRVVLFPNDVKQFIGTLPKGSIRLIVTSPPYNLGKDYEKKKSLDDYLNEQEHIISDLRNLLTDDGSICWQVGNYVNNGEVFPLDIFYYQIFKRHKFILRNRVIWHYGHGLHARKRFSGRYETILWFSKSDKYVFNLDSVRIPAKYPGKRHSRGKKKGEPSGNPKGKNPSDVWMFLASEWETSFWDIPNVKANHIEKTSHPCQFPVEVAERCILALSHQDDWVFDPYAGVGTSLIAGIKNNRKVLGCEKEDEYVQIARQRISEFFAGNLRIRPLGQPVYEPNGKEKVAQIPTEWLE